MTAKERQGWQRQYNQLQDLLGKSYDRVLNGTATMVKLTTPKESSKSRANSKPGFQPLKPAVKEDNA